ncbi:TVP38/TMEM64 family protein [Aeoliella mucimassa]|uniref:SNARE associated Golgi protein n=1 Tax=Aeoliella mucimassa TaxID=2527972 RepID=A0A518AVZ6_9BACT|nr:VTT domain-containing protein [Aeoliella mucimassa]QDU58894.1 SNARE associated Golgi protein [Aeoliella mucimassa]
MRLLVRLVGVIAIVLAIPMVTALFWSGPLESLLERWQAEPPSTGWVAGLLIALLASDILLPVPSGPVITLAGGQIGVLPTAIAAWTGLMLGGLAAFAVAKRLGPAVTRRLASPEDLEGLKSTARQHDAWLLLVTRPLPILAEATVLLCGTLDTSWPRLLWTLGIGNAAVATAFAVLGQQASEQEWMFMAIVLSVVVPLAMTWVVRHRWLKQQRRNERVANEP